MRKNILNMAMFVFAIGFLFFASAFTANAQPNRRVSNDDWRRTIYKNDCAELSSLINPRTLPQYKNEYSIQGFHKTTAGAIGWTEVWNEVSANKVCRTILKPDAPVWVINGEANPTFGYLDGCFHPSIKGFKNRIIVVEKVLPPEPTPIITPVATPTPEPECQNIRGLKIETAAQLGYTINEQGVCSKYEPPPPPQKPMCVNAEMSSFTLEQARQLSYEVSDAGVCSKPVQVEYCTEGDTRLTVDQARGTVSMTVEPLKRGGYKCYYKKRGGGWVAPVIGAVCVGVGEFFRDGKLVDSVVRVGTGAGGGYIGGRVTKSKWGGLLGCGAIFIPNVSGSSKGKKTLPTSGSQVPIRPNPNNPSGTVDCRRGADGRCLPPITSSGNTNGNSTGNNNSGGNNNGNPSSGPCRPGTVCTQGFVEQNRGSSQQSRQNSASKPTANSDKKFATRDEVFIAN